MLLLMFRVSDHSYAIEARHVREVVPRVALRAVPHAPEYLEGLLDYRGRVVPVVDLGLLLGASPCRRLLSTRVIVVDPPREGAGALGLVAEEVSDVRYIRDDQVVFPPTPLEQAPYLGAVVRVEEGLVQLIRVERVLDGTPLEGSLAGEG